MHLLQGLHIASAVWVVCYRPSNKFGHLLGLSMVIFIELIRPAMDNGSWVQRFKSCSTFVIRGIKFPLKSFEKQSGTATPS